MAVRDDMPRDLDRLTGRPVPTAPAAGALIPADVWRDDEAFYLQFDLPGVDRAGIDLTIERGRLTLTAERPSPIPAHAHAVLTERLTGRFTRRLELSDALDTDAIEAHHDNGVLTLRIPFSAHAKPRRIPIGGGGRKQLPA